MNIQQLLWYTNAAPAISPIAQLNLKAGPKAPLPEKDGAYRSVVSMKAGPMAATPAPYIQSSCLAYLYARLQWLFGEECQ